MPNQPFEIAERELESGCREIQITGELDLAVAAELKDALARAAEDADAILLCLDGCEFIDSTGIAIIVQAHNRIAGGGCALVVHSAAGQVLRTLTISGLASNGLLFETRDEALALVRDRA